MNVEGRRELANDLAGTYQNKANALASQGDLQAAVSLCDRAIEVYERVVKAGRIELRGERAWAQVGKAEVLLALGEREMASEEAQEAVLVLQDEVARTGRSDLQSVLNWAREQFKEVL